MKKLIFIIPLCAAALCSCANKTQSLSTADTQSSVTATESSQSESDATGMPVINMYYDSVSYTAYPLGVVYEGYRSDMGEDTLSAFELVGTTHNLESDAQFTENFETKGLSDGLSVYKKKDNADALHPFIVEYKSETLTNYVTLTYFDTWDSIPDKY